jgi:oligopeptide/dipeptide ABC transporter ATP-binding protein
MYLGKLVELGDTQSIFKNPTHPYTQALLSAVPRLDPDEPRTRVEFNTSSFQREVPLREIGRCHWAAI